MDDNDILKVRFMKDGRNLCIDNGSLLPKGVNVIHQYFYIFPLYRIKEIVKVLNCSYYLAKEERI